jgi:hypothetical protein
LGQIAPVHAVQRDAKKRDRFDIERVDQVDCRCRMSERDRQTTRTRIGW